MTSSLAAGTNRRRPRSNGNAADARAWRTTDSSGTPVASSIVVAGQREHAENLQGDVAAVITPMGLRLSPEKTRVVHINHGFHFLDLNSRRMRKRGSTKSYAYTHPSKKSVASIKARVKTMSYNTVHRDPGYLMKCLSPVLRGWAIYALCREVDYPY